jgi:hypothetical protein
MKFNQSLQSAERDFLKKETNSESGGCLQAENNIHRLFTQFPKLREAGTEKQYYKYLETVFPDADEQIKSLIFKHKTVKNPGEVNEEDYVKERGMFFSAGEFAKNSKIMNTLYCKLNIKKLAHAGGSVVLWNKDKIIRFKNLGYDGAYGSHKKDGTMEGRGLDAFRVECPNKSEEEILKIAEASLYSSGVLDVSVEEKYAEVVVFDMDQVFFLGQEKDVAGFDRWVKANKATVG